MHAETGQFLAVQVKGAPGLPGDGARFANHQAAVKRAEELVAEMPFAHALVTDLATDETERIINPVSGDYLREKCRYLHYRSLGFIQRMFKAAPKCKHFDPKHLDKFETL